MFVQISVQETYKAKHGPRYKCARYLQRPRTNLPRMSHAWELWNNFHVWKEALHFSDHPSGSVAPWRLTKQAAFIWQGIKAACESSFCIRYLPAVLFILTVCCCQEPPCPLQHYARGSHAVWPGRDRWTAGETRVRTRFIGCHLRFTYKRAMCVCLWYIFFKIYIYMHFHFIQNRGHHLLTVCFYFKNITLRIDLLLLSRKF